MWNMEIPFPRKFALQGKAVEFHGSVYHLDGYFGIFLQKCLNIHEQLIFLDTKLRLYSGNSCIFSSSLARDPWYLHNRIGRLPNDFDMERIPGVVEDIISVSSLTVRSWCLQWYFIVRLPSSVFSLGITSLGFLDETEFIHLDGRKYKIGRRDEWLC